MALLRRAIGETLRERRLRQQRTLRDVSARARVSLGYLSEIERGQKEASSELLDSICAALDVPLADLLREASDALRAADRRSTAAAGPARSGAPIGKVVIPAITEAHAHAAGLLRR